ncbi:MAG: nucleotide exchange factor GrpE [Salinivirgaceae bacterium]|jgi:Molecular chaperone GrpE (heat shock protein)|nr:nucleotide exchange factor GrpE [Salinivirgaceae bacterium]MBR3569024.1 nucleotide exchange factor GrpE [Salinivirgaceae bacterium]
MENTEQNTEQVENEVKVDVEQSQPTENEEVESDGKKSRKNRKQRKEDEAREKEIEELKAQLEEQKDRYLRLSAEFDNYRKRTLKERSDMLKTVNGDTLSGMLPVLDDLERAMQSMQKATDVDAVREGVVLIYNKIQEFLKNKGIVEIDAMNQVFDTDLHEAITKIPAPTEDLKGKVVDVIQKGYKIDTKVIRYAKVVVGE